MVIGDPATNAGVAPVDATKGLAVDLTATGANSTAIKTDSSATTQPVSGTVTANLGTIAGVATAAKQPALGTAGTASSDVISIQGIAAMTKLLVTPDSVALPANQSVNVSQINGVTTTMNNGIAGTGVQRVTIASDSTGQITANAGTNLNTSALATEAGNLATIAAAVKTEDVASANADKGIPAMAIRDDTLNATSGTEGDYEFLHTTSDGALWVTQAPSTSNGWSTFMASSGDGSTALTNTAQAVKASAGTLGGWYIYNPNATATYVIIYNTAQGSVTVGTTNPQMVLCIPPTSAANVEFGNGINFTTAISVAATTTGGGNSAPSTALESNFYYKQL